MSLTDYVIMPGEDYQAICDSVRAKTGRTDILKSGDISPLIDRITVDMSDGGTQNLLERTRIVTEYDSTMDCYVATITSDSTITVGKTYIVEWDGVEYSCVATKNVGYVTIANSQTEVSKTGLGNATIAKKVFGLTIKHPTGSDTGEPFYVGVDSSSYKIISIHTQDNKGAHIVKISEAGI